jgi:hypothetical protein
MPTQQAFDETLYQHKEPIKNLSYASVIGWFEDFCVEVLQLAPRTHRQYFSQGAMQQTVKVVCQFLLFSQQGVLDASPLRYPFILSKIISKHFGQL